MPVTFSVISINKTGPFERVTQTSGLEEIFFSYFFLSPHNFKIKKKQKLLLVAGRGAEEL